MLNAVKPPFQGWIVHIGIHHDCRCVGVSTDVFLCSYVRNVVCCSDAWTLEMVNIGLVPLGMTHTLSHLPIQPALGTASSTNSSSGGRGPGAAAPATAGQTPSAGGQPPHPVTSPLGKFVVFPNCHAHRLRKLINTSTTECVTRRIVAFFIINPRKRIESTREHPSSPRTMSLAEAQAARLNLMKERKFAKQDLNPRHIELCEH